MERAPKAICYWAPADPGAFLVLRLKPPPDLGRTAEEGDGLYSQLALPVAPGVERRWPGVLVGGCGTSLEMSLNPVPYM